MGFVAAWRKFTNRGLGRRAQCAAGWKGAGEAESNAVRALAQLRPSDPITSLVVKNAFGSMRWQDAIRVLIAFAPKLAVPIACVRADGHAEVIAVVEEGLWTTLSMLGSLVQGDVQARPALLHCYGNRHRGCLPWPGSHTRAESYVVVVLEC